MVRVSGRGGAGGAVVLYWYWYGASSGTVPEAETGLRGVSVNDDLAIMARTADSLTVT